MTAPFYVATTFGDTVLAVTENKMADLAIFKFGNAIVH